MKFETKKTTESSRYIDLNVFKNMFKDKNTHENDTKVDQCIDKDNGFVMAWICMKYFGDDTHSIRQCAINCQKTLKVNENADDEGEYYLFFNDLDKRFSSVLLSQILKKVKANYLIVLQDMTPVKIDQ